MIISRSDSYTFWLNMSSRCRSSLSLDSRQGLMSFLGRMSPSSDMFPEGWGEEEDDPGDEDRGLSEEEASLEMKMLLFSNMFMIDLALEEVVEELDPPTMPLTSPMMMKRSRKRTSKHLNQKRNWNSKKWTSWSSRRLELWCSEKGR